MTTVEALARLRVVSLDDLDLLLDLIGETDDAIAQAFHELRAYYPHDLRFENPWPIYELRPIEQPTGATGDEP